MALTAKVSTAACHGSDSDLRRHLWEIIMLRQSLQFWKLRPRVVLAFPTDVFCFSNRKPHLYENKRKECFLWLTDHKPSAMCFYICMTFRQIKWNDWFSRHSESKITDGVLGKEILMKIWWESGSLSGGFWLKTLGAIYNEPKPTFHEHALIGSLTTMFTEKISPHSCWVIKNHRNRALRFHIKARKLKSKFSSWEISF